MADVNEQVLAEARRRLDSQVQRLDELRSRSVALLGFAAVAASLFGLRTTSAEHHTHRRHHDAVEVGIFTPHGFLAGAAFTAFSLIVVLAIMINRPGDWNDGERLDKWIVRIVEAPDLAGARFSISVANSLNRARNENASMVRRRARLIKWMCGLLAAQVVCAGLAALVDR